MILNILLALTAWVASPQEEELLQEKIAKVSVATYKVTEKEHLITPWKDVCFFKTNFGKMECQYCQKGDTSTDVQKLLEEHGFIRHEIVSHAEGHCQGVTLAFARYLQEYPPVYESCMEYLSRFKPDVSHVHAWSVNQPPHYKVASEDAKLFYELITGRKVNFVSSIEEKNIALRKTDVAVYAALREFKDHTVLVGHCDDKGVAHVTLFYVGERLFVFDSLLGLEEFANLETLSALYGKLWEQERFDLIVAFPNKS